MDAPQRLAQMALLCRLSNWTLDQFWNELRTRYPNGPEPHGLSWDHYAAEVEALYREAMRND